MNNNIKLIAKTLHGKNKLFSVKQKNPDWDGTWRVCSKADTVHFASGGPWLLIEPLALNADSFTRWVRPTNDLDFFVEEA